MARIRKIVTPLLAAAAVSILTGCRPKEMQRCVDEHDNVVDDKLCANQPNAQPLAGQNHGTYVPNLFPYHYYYGGGGGFGLGSHVYGGGYVPLAGRSYSTSGGRGIFGGVTRGGFGSSFGGGGE